MQQVCRSTWTDHMETCARAMPGLRREKRRSSQVAALITDGRIPLVRRIEALSVQYRYRETAMTNSNQCLPWIIGMLAVLLCPQLQAQTPSRQDHAAIHRGVENYLRVQTAGSPHRITLAVTPIDARLSLAACPALDFFLPAGARLWGQTAVGVRCTTEPSWSLFVTAYLTVTGNYLVVARPVSQGQTVAESDLTLRSGDLTQLPASVLSEPAQALGKTVAVTLSAGQPLTRDMLRAPLILQQGQSVLLQSSGSGFMVTAQGKALNNAYEGQVAQVRTASGLTVSGLARPGGIVEIRSQ